MTITFFKNWAEIIAFVLLIIGFLFSLGAPSAFLSYIIIFAAGMMAGRLFYERKNKMIFPYFLMVLGFLIGYLIGTRYGNWLVISVLFIIGTIISYQLHEKNIIKDIRY